MSYTTQLNLYAGIKLDKNYNNICDNVTLSSLSEYLVTTINNLRFIRNDQQSGSVQLEYPYSDIIGCNYLSFINMGYSSKPFFAFIDKIIYISDKNVEIQFTIDHMSTYWYDWSTKSCMVLREHVNNDTIGSNTQPESVSIGSSYVATNTGIFNLASPNTPMLLGYLASGEANPDSGGYTAISDNFSGILSGLHPTMGVPVSDIPSVNALLGAYTNNGTEDRVVKVFQYPSILGDVTKAKNGFSTEIALPPHNTIDGYSPRNNKLLTYPFQVLKIYSTDGDSRELQFELFDDGVLKIKGAVLPSCKFKLYPTNYAGVDEDYGKAIYQNCDIEVAWIGDAYKQWVANNTLSESVGLAVNTIGATGQIVGGAMAGNPAMMASGVLSMGTSIAGTVNDIENARRASSQVHGGLGGNGMAIMEGSFGFTIQVLTIKREYAVVIDDYFTKYGYAINRLKQPNITGRTYYNYVQVSGDIGNGNVPADIMSDINTVFNRGVTIWHNLANIGDYNLNNDI